MDRALGQGFDQDAAQLAAQDLGPATTAVVGLLEEHRAVAVEHAGRLASLVDDGLESLR